MSFYRPKASNNQAHPKVTWCAQGNSLNDWVMILGKPPTKLPRVGGSEPHEAKSQMGLVA
jgi:hypothetical protein